MSRAFGGFMKGMGAGIVCGVAVATVGTAMMRGQKKTRRGAMNAVRAVGDLVHNVQYMMK